jgi:hypothetical protein
VHLTGSDLDAVTAVRFNGVAAVMERDSPGSMWTTVPPRASSGPLTLEWPGGTTRSSTLFTVTDSVSSAGPEITDVSPASVLAGAEIVISGRNLTQPFWFPYSFPIVTFGSFPVRTAAGGFEVDGTWATLTYFSPDKVKILAPMRPTRGRVVVTTSQGMATSLSEIVVLPGPLVTSMSPTVGPAATEVALEGTDLHHVEAVSFNGVAAAILSRSPTILTVSVPAGATSGRVTIHYAGTATGQAGSFTTTPAILALSPNPAFAGTPVTITGTNLRAPTGSPTVRVGAALVTLRPGGTTETLQITLPAAAVTGRVTVTTPEGSGTGPVDLVVVRRPTVTSFAPALGPVGTVVTVGGPNLAEVTSVQFNGEAAAFTLVSATSLRATVPRGATSGVISLSTRAGNVNSLTRFTVLPPGDLRVMAVTAAARAAAGRPTSVTTTVRNTGGSPVPASMLRLYLSADEALDAGDRLLASRTIGNLAVGTAMALTIPTTVPGDVASGLYRVLVAIDVTGGAPESDATNNIAVSEPVNVELYLPNLAMTVLTPPVRGAVGQPMTVPNTVRNTGPAPAGAFVIRFHLSADLVLDEQDAVIGTRALGSLAAISASTASTPLRLPAGIEPGQYYVIAVADALGQQVEGDEADQTLVAGPLHVLPYRPEFAMTGLTVPARGAIGQTVAVTNAVRNTGLAPATAFTVRFHLSRDDVLDAGDPVVGLRSVGSLPAGSASVTSTTLRIPTNTTLGEYRVIAVVDASEQQGELDETNNVTVSAPFSVVAYVPAPPVDPGECGSMRALGWAKPAGCPDPYNPGIGGDSDD